jgi:probable rRNA maturation factor
MIIQRINNFQNLDEHNIFLMNYHIDIQQASKEVLPVTDDTLIYWASTALYSHYDTAELTLRMVDPEEITQLNHIYRHQNKPTNVLSFPASYPKNIELDIPLLGDVIICPSVLKEESQSLGKPLTDHCAHIVLHGVLHLLGYDHIEPNDAEKMQALEIQLLSQLNFEIPYQP